MKTTLLVGQAIDIGISRVQMEDAYYLRYGSYLPEVEKMGAIFLVSDGVGGNQGGALASRLAAETIPLRYYNAVDNDPAASLARAIQQVNAEIYQEGQRQGIFRMSTTVVVAVIRQNELFVSHIGDSRAYLLHNNNLSQLTRDHSWVNEQINHGELTPEQAKVSAERNIITRSLGFQPKVQVDPTQRLPLAVGDRLMLCTDGLYDCLTAEQIKEILQTRPPQEACDEFVRLANTISGSDNITVIVVELALPGERRVRTLHGDQPARTSGPPIQKQAVEERQQNEAIIELSIHHFGEILGTPRDSDITDSARIEEAAHDPHALEDGGSGVIEDAPASAAPSTELPPLPTSALLEDRLYLMWGNGQRVVDGAEKWDLLGGRLVVHLTALRKISPDYPDMLEMRWILDKSSGCNRLIPTQPRVAELTYQRLADSNSFVVGSQQGRALVLLSEPLTLMVAEEVETMPAPNVPGACLLRKICLRFLQLPESKPDGALPIEDEKPLKRSEE